MEGRTEEKLIRLFTMDGKPFVMQYGTRGHRREDWKADKPVLDSMIKKGTLAIVEKTNKSIRYHYTPKEIAS